MPRHLRIDFAGAIHHVMNRGVDHQRTFFSDQDRVDFGAQLAAIHQRFGIEILAYCLMDNHYHLLLRTPEGGLPAAMKHLGQVYTRHTNDRVGRDGPLFRGRYHSILVTTDSYLLWATRYIHRNALDIHGVDAPTDYRWSSYRAYIGLRRAPAFLRPDLVLDHFDQDRGALARFTESEESLQSVISAPTVADLLQHVQLAVAADDLRHGDDATRSGTARTALVLLSDRLAPGPLQAALVEHLGFPSAHARRAAVWRATHHRNDDRDIAAHVAQAVLANLRVDRPAA